jgi:hypothetical protein
MNLDAKALAKAVRRLCKGEGARIPSRWRRVDLHVAHVCGITECDLPGQMPRKLAHAVDRLLPDHPGEKELLLTALGLDPAARQDSLEVRLDQLVRKRFLSDRTMRRRLDDAIDVFVRAAVAEERASAAAGDVCYMVDNFDATAAFDGDKIRVIERRKIRSTKDQLCVVTCWLGVLQAPLEEDEPAFRVELVSGGLRCEVSRQPGAVEVRIELAQPLDAGQMHEFEISYELPLSQLRGPYYVVQPVTPFGTVSLAIRFDPRRVPIRAWRIDGVMPPQVDSYPADGGELLLDPSACVRATFRDVHPGRAYGIGWDWT